MNVLAGLDSSASRIWVDNQIHKLCITSKFPHYSTMARVHVAMCLAKLKSQIETTHDYQTIEDGFFLPSE